MDTKKLKIKNLLLSGEKLTVKTAWLKAQTTELRHYISLLKKDGLNIKSNWVLNELEGLRYKQYYL